MNLSREQIRIARLLFDWAKNHNVPEWLARREIKKMIENYPIEKVKSCLTLSSLKAMRKKLEYVYKPKPLWTAPK